ncbi:MAG: UDP-N-acetylmuramate--L-alanine ligase [Candidatus Moranbacteria bacterium]|nr:UDP-N-acetylmuramate--L-alanine ligase [Candidatus Moranbacteria bacterium]
MSFIKIIPTFSGKRVHMVGIKGAGMTALAEILVKGGATVTGSDTAEVFFTDDVLKKIGIVPFVGFSTEHVAADVDHVIYSTAYSPDKNQELAAASSRGIPLLNYPEAVGMLTRERMGLLVAGTHGKTTISAMLAEALRNADEDPVAIVGSRVRAWDGNALAGDGKYLVLEADEYQDKLRYYQPFSAILTSIDWDHPDFFLDEHVYADAFREFVCRIPHHGALVYCADSASVVKVAADATCRRLSYGFNTDADFHIIGYEAVSLGTVEAGGTRTRFEIVHEGESLGMFSLRIPGKHNAQNAASVVALASFLRIDMEAVRTALAEFSGTARRSEFIGEYKAALVYDDYAHHPEELRATLSAFRELYPDKTITAVFHPHTFTRTAALLSEFAQSFDDADHVLVLDIYGSAREGTGRVTSMDLVREINRFVHDKAEYVPTIPEVVEKLKGSLHGGDLLITFGAGDVWRVAEGVTGKAV